MTEPVTVNLLLACTQAAACNSARKWGWPPAVLRIRGRMAFIDPEGDLVMVTSSAEDLRGILPDVKVYLGESWIFAHGKPQDGLRAHTSKGGRVLVDNWKAGIMTGFTPPAYYF